MNVILSIKPDYCEKIKRRKKKIEFRKKIFRWRSDVDFVFMYSTAPVKKIVGAFKIESIVEDHPKRLWERFKDLSGVKEEEFFKYFGSSEIGFAIKIKEVKIFEPPLDPKVLLPNFTPPQSFRYVSQLKLKEGFLDTIKQTM
jgi:predicted transcriptional regulator